MQTIRLNAILAANPRKRKIVGMEPTLPTVRDLSVTLNKKERGITPSNQRQLSLSKTQKTNYAADIQFNIGTYAFTDTFVILSKLSFSTKGLNFMRNYQAVLDTANGTINFPHVEMTLALTDEMKNCIPKPLQIMAEGNQML